MHADSFLLQLTPPDTLSSLDCMHARLPVTAIIIPMRATEARLKQIERAALTVWVLISYRRRRSKRPLCFMVKSRNDVRLMIITPFRTKPLISPADGFDSLPRLSGCFKITVCLLPRDALK